MKLEHLAYRARQFREALRAAPASADLKLAQTYLTPAQMELFSRMQASEQAHSLQVCKQLVHEENLDLLVAALLHDVGKSRHPLSVWERVLIVFMKSLFPRQLKQWGTYSPTGNGGLPMDSLRRPFIVAEQHPQWGADMASAAGASPIAIRLILQHQNVLDSEPETLEDRLLVKLQAADSAY